jgi:hypothetical protein
LLLLLLLLLLIDAVAMGKDPRSYFFFLHGDEN